MKFVGPARIAVIFALLLLSACGGGDSKSSASTINTGSAQVAAEDFQILGGGVKGPLAFADTRLYRLDISFADFYDTASPISTAMTNEFAQISGLSVPADIQPPFILTIGGRNAVDLNTGIAPVIKTLVTVVTKEMLMEGLPIYATPLTTLAFQLARHGTATSASTATFLQQLRREADQVGKLFSIDQTTAVDIFRSPLVIDSSTVEPTKQKEAVYHRAALEAFAAKVQALALTAENVSADEIIDRLAEDLQSDGVIDNTNNGKTIGAIDPKVVGEDPMGLVIPNTQYRVKDVMQLMDDERILLGTASTGPNFQKDKIQLPVTAAPSITPNTFPVKLQGSAPEETTVVMNVRKPATSASAIVTLSVFDADFPGEGELIINGNSPVALFGTTATAANDQLRVNVPIATPHSYWNDGENTLVFRHVSTDGGYIVESASVAFKVADPVVYEPIITLSTADIQFGNQDIGGVAGPKLVKVTNSGNAALTISAISVPSGFLATDNCNNYLPVGKTCTVSVSFVPTQTGYISGMLVIRGDAGAYKIKLSGTGSTVPLIPTATAKPVKPSTTARYLAEDFENGDWAKRYDVLGSVYREGGKTARSGAFGLRIQVTKGEHWGGRILFNHARHGQVGDFKEIWARYYVRFGPNWRRNDERLGKAGFRVRSDEVCNAPCLEMTDSHELTASGAIAGYSYFHRYVSDANIDTRSFQYSRRNWNGGNREREQWYCVETHHVLNTPGQKNGVYQNWVGGTLVSDQSDLRQRDSATFDIDSSVLIAYVGGDWVADRDMNIYFDDWAVSDTRIGCQ